MSDARYTLLLEGFPDTDPDSARAALAKTFGLQPETAAELLARAPIAIKRGVPEPQLRAYIDALLKIGADVTTRSEGDGTVAHHRQPRSERAPTGPLTYSIELVGHPGRSASEAAAGLAEAFAIPAQAAIDLVARAPVTVKRDVPEDDLATYVDALSAVGFAVLTVCEQTGDAVHHQAAPTGDPAGGEPLPTASSQPSEVGPVPARQVAGGVEVAAHAASVEPPGGSRPDGDLPGAHVVADRSPEGVTGGRPMWQVKAIRYAPAACGLAALLIVSMLVWDCMSSDRKPVSGKYRDKHLGMYFFFPDGWYQRVNRSFSKRESNGILTRGSNFYRGDADDPELSLIVARLSDLPSTGEMPVLDFDRLAANIEGYGLGGYHIRGVHCEPWLRKDYVGQCAGHARARGRERAMLMFVFYDNGHMFFFMFIHKRDYELIAGEAGAIFEAARLALRVSD